jgi:hypothetical protein
LARIFIGFLANKKDGNRLQHPAPCRIYRMIRYSFKYKGLENMLIDSAKAMVVGGTNIPASTNNLTIVILTKTNLKLYSDTTEVINRLKLREA